MAGASNCNNDFLDNITSNFNTNNINIKIEDDCSTITGVNENISKFFIKYSDENYKNEGTIKNSDYIQIVIVNAVYHFLKSAKANVEYILHYLQDVDNEKYTYYEMFLNILFITIVFIILLIMYWDNVYRVTNQTSRCVKIQDIINVNNENDYPFIYYISVINEKNINNLKDKFILRLEYNFFKKTTKYVFGSQEYLQDVILPLGIDEDKKDIFKYYDLQDMQSKEVYMKNNSISSIYIDKDIITSKKYKFIVTTPSYMVLNDDASIELAKFVKKYGKYSDITELNPIYNILSAVEQKNIAIFI
jgi:hypothetical protein